MPVNLEEMPFEWIFWGSVALFTVLAGAVLLFRIRKAKQIHGKSRRLELT
jgi:hypothetical protein